MGYRTSVGTPQAHTNRTCIYGLDIIGTVRFENNNVTYFKHSAMWCVSKSRTKQKKFKAEQMFWKGSRRKEEALLNLEWNETFWNLYTNLWNLEKKQMREMNRWNLVCRAKEARKWQNECEVTSRNRSSCVTANRKPCGLTQGGVA